MTMMCAPFLGLGVVSVARDNYLIVFGWLGGNAGKTILKIGNNPLVADFTYDFYAYSSTSDTTGTLTKSADPGFNTLNLIERPVLLDDQMAACLGIKMHLVSQSGSSYGTYSLTSDMTMDTWMPLVVSSVRGRKITLSLNTTVSGASAEAKYEYSVGFFDGTHTPSGSLAAVAPNGISVFTGQNGMAHF